MMGRDLVDRFDRKRMFQTAMGVLRNRQEAEDAVQDALIGLLDRDLDSDPVRFNAYACYCVRHRAIERWRKSQEGIQRVTIAMPTDDRFGAGDLASEVERRILAERIAVALAKEAPEDRLCATVRPQEAARLLGVPVGTVKSRGFRVRARVRGAVMESS